MFFPSLRLAWAQTSKHILSRDRMREQKECYFLLLSDTSNLYEGFTWSQSPFPTSSTRLLGLSNKKHSVARTGIHHTTNVALQTRPVTLVLPLLSPNHLSIGKVQAILCLLNAGFSSLTGERLPSSYFYYTKCTIL